MFGPSGTRFTDWVSLAITPPTEVPVEDQFVFQLNDDATEFGAAFVDPTSTAPTILLDHFSGYGLALGGVSDSGIADSFAAYSKAYEEQVVKPRLEAASASCESWERASAPSSATNGSDSCSAVRAQGST